MNSKKNNSKFNKKEDFVILNIPSDADRNSVLNAIEFKDDATIAYISYTNLDLQNPEMQVWTEVNKETDGFYIKDHRTDRIHTAISSSIGTSKSSLTSVPIATTLKFKVNFPPIKDRENLGLIDLVEGASNSSWKFTDIDMSKYRNQLVKFDTKAYQKDYAYSLMQNGDWAESMSILNSILDEDPDDEQALNTLGIISYVLKNYTNANLYFTRAIEAHPNSINGYMNRCWLYVENGDKKSALDDLSAAVGIDNRYYYRRAMLYESMEDYANAKQDYSNYLSQVSLDNDEKARVYYNRALCNLNLKLTDECTKDLKKAYELTSDPQLKKALKPYVTATTASSSSKKYEFFSNGSFRITKCSVGITDYNSNIITNYGAPLYSSKTKYLKPKLEIKSNVSGNYKIYYRFFNPDGTLSTGSNSPSGYSSYSEISLYKGSVTQYLLGWGSNNPGTWKPGTINMSFLIQTEKI